LDAAWTGKRSLDYRLYTLVGYAFGLLVAIFMARQFQVAQPALLYLVPSVIGSLLYRARQTDTIKDVWEGVPLQYTRLDTGMGENHLGEEIV
jgi:alpha/beta superfamily hydrolase